MDFLDEKKQVIKFGGLFSTRPKLIKAYQIDQYESFTDQNGEQFRGIPGDFKILDDRGYVYFMNKYEFDQKYTPHDNTAFLIKIKG